MNEWCALKEKAPEILVHVSNLELGITPQDSDPYSRDAANNAENDDGEVPTQVPMYTWRSFNDKNCTFEQSPQPYYLEKQCIEDGAAYQALKNRKDKVLIAKKYSKVPDSDLMMRASYVYRARQLMTRYRRGVCDGCNDRLAGGNDPKHLLGCKME
jgi:hypothetical protein